MTSSQYRHGNLTIIHSKESWNIWKWFKPTPKKSRYIFLFDDGEIFETNINEITDQKFKFFYGTYIPFPVWFEKKVDSHKTEHNRCFFYKNRIQNETDTSSDFNHLFQSYSNYIPSKTIQSDCNIIYHSYKVGTQPEIFGLIRIKSNEHMPQFQFAYDHEEFTKDEIMYLIHYMFDNLKSR